MRKEKIREVRLCFITGYFVKPFQKKINHFFYFWSWFTAQFLLFDIKDIKRGNWERQIARDGKLNIYLKNNFNLLVMKVTQLNFLKFTCLICLVSVLICISNCEDFICRTFEDCIGLCDTHYCCSYFRRHLFIKN